MTMTNHVGEKNAAMVLLAEFLTDVCPTPFPLGLCPVAFAVRIDGAERTCLARLVPHMAQDEGAAVAAFTYVQALHVHP